MSSMCGAAACLLRRPAREAAPPLESAPRPRPSPLAAASMGRLTTIRQGAAMKAGLPIGANG
eukprot:scaffold2866_cov148-Isochrysis_galbana.AAC.19